jgi:hypothetical protein
MSITEAIIKIADYYMKKIIPCSPTHLKDSQVFIKEIVVLSPHAKLFTANATVMYTTIQLDMGISAIAGWIKAYPNTVPKDFPQQLLLKLLDIIMHCNVFSLDDTNWLQEIRTTMGTPCVCYYAMLSYAFHEVHKILADFAKLLLLLKSFIDDMFGIWIHDPGIEWEQLKKHLRDLGN